MKRIKIFRSGKLTNESSGENHEVDAWLARCLAKNKFGKPERWVRAEVEDVSGALQTRQVEIAPAVLDELGNVVTPAVFETEYKLPAQFTVVEENIDGEIAAAKAKELARAAAQERIDALDIQQKLAGATTVATLRLAVQEILSDLVAIRKR